MDDGENADETRPQPGRQMPPRTPRWVLVLGILAFVLILAVVAQLVFGIRHGPGLH
ncbi:MAG: hypothetical protein H0W81_13020 [Chloroflexi bacterium]|nr:hypothetical protein [Chloroflexota bacterium]